MSLAEKITVPVERTEQRLVGLLSLFIASSYPTIILTDRLLTKNCPTCIKYNIYSNDSGVKIKEQSTLQTGHHSQSTNV